MRVYLSGIKKHYSNIVPFILLIFLLAGGVVEASGGLKIDGLLENYYGFQIGDDGNIIATRNQLKVNLSSNNKNLYFFTSLIAEDNQIVNSKNGFRSEEMYFEYYQNDWDIRVGKQYFSWGRSDGIQITDILCPGDNREFNNDFDESRIAVNSLRYRYLFSAADIELVWIPVFTEAKYPVSIDNPWYIRQEIPEQITIGEAALPEKNLENGEIAGRISFYYKGTDYTISTAYLFDDQPIYKLEGNNLFPEYKRLSYASLNLSRPIGDMVSRIETAYFYDKYFAVNEESFFTTGGYLKKDYLHTLVGLDYYPGNDWFMSCQFIYKDILDYDDIISEERRQYSGTLTVRKSLLRGTLELENVLYYHHNNNGVYNSFLADYAVTDNYHIKAGIDIFSGDKGEFAAYNDNDFLWIKNSYSF